MHKVHPGANLHPGSNVHIIRRNLKCLNVQCIISVYACGEGGCFLDFSTAECVVETFTLHPYKSQIRKAYSLHENDILFV